MKKKYFIVAAVFVLAVCSYLAFTAVDSKTPVAFAAGTTYSASVYVAGHGGHFAKADITIDPSNADDPITVASLDKVDIGNTKSHKTHDARIDSQDSNTLFWSTYQLDENGKQHVGKSDLKTGKVLIDKALDPDKRSTGGEKKMPIYCASGQSTVYYMPVFMGSEAYVDVFDKKTLEHKHRVFISDLGYKAGTYQFLHGINSNKKDKFILTMTMKGEDGAMNGKIDFVLVDLKQLEKGKFKELKRKTYTGVATKTITFRDYFSKDDKYIFQAAGDRLWVLDANTLEMVDEKMSTAGENHDLMPTPDGKYALLTIRDKNTQGCDAEGKPVMDKEGKPVVITDGMLQLYDFGAKKIVGKPDSVCFGCHKSMGIGDKAAILCGLDANYKK